MIRHLLWGLPVEPIAKELENPAVWDLHPERRVEGPHEECSDVWVRYAEKFEPGPHESVWYEEAKMLPATVDMCFEVMRLVRGTRLGGVLVTKIPAGKRCKPHRDAGWHAEYYEKFALQIASNEDQRFCFQDRSMVTMPGDLFTFDNSHLHWVKNESDEDRITLIICLRR